MNSLCPGSGFADVRVDVFVAGYVLLVHALSVVVVWLSCSGCALGGWMMVYSLPLCALSSLGSC